jgi:hypothetical protein
VNAYERWGRFLDDKRYTRPIFRPEIELISQEAMVDRIEYVRMTNADRCLACGSERRQDTEAVG